MQKCKRMVSFRRWSRISARWLAKLVEAGFRDTITREPTQRRFGGHSRLLRDFFTAMGRSNGRSSVCQGYLVRRMQSYSLIIVRGSPTSYRSTVGRVALGRPLWVSSHISSFLRGVTSLTNIIRRCGVSSLISIIHRRYWVSSPINISSPRPPLTGCT